MDSEKEGLAAQVAFIEAAKKAAGGPVSLSKKTGLPRRTIARWEGTNAASYPSLYTIAKATGVPLPPLTGQLPAGGLPGELVLDCMQVLDEWLEEKGYSLKDHNVKRHVVRTMAEAALEQGIVPTSDLLDKQQVPFTLVVGGN